MDRTKVWKREHPPEVRDRIIDTLSEGVPFLALAAEANGVSRKTMEDWMSLGRRGDPKYADFAAKCDQIRARWMLDNAMLLTSADKNTAEAARQRAWLLQKVDRQTFDPPKEVFEKVKPRLAGEETPQGTDAPPTVEAAIDQLSKPATH